MAELHVTDLVGKGRPELVLIEASQGTRGHHEAELAARVRTHTQIDGPKRFDAQRHRAAVFRSMPDPGADQQRRQGDTELGLLWPGGATEGKLSRGSAPHEQ